MRRQHFQWTYMVIAIVLTAYGGFSFIYYKSRNLSIPLLGIVFLSIGITMILIYLVLYFISRYQKNHRHVVKESFEETTVKKEVEEIKSIEEEKEEVKPASPKKSYSDEVTYERVRTSNRSIYDNDYSTIYVRKTGYGPVLRVTGSEILDMRSNTYYRIEGNMVKMSGSGPVYQISGNRIRAAFGGYLYEIFGDSVSKVYGGYYASFSGNILQTNDLSERYEMDGSLSTKQKLAVVALLFGTY